MLHRTLPRLFLLMTLGRPRSTLFPYTTLFRSLADGDGRATVRAAAAEPGSRRHQPVYGAHGTGQDRKSTRLNSSHTVISYAVFCLKKKDHQSEHEGDATR